MTEKIYRINDNKERNELYSDYKNTGGVYKLHCLKPGSDHEFIPLNRILVIDKEDVLYIGKTGPAAARVGDLFKTISDKYDSNRHHVGI